MSVISFQKEVPIFTNFKNQIYKYQSTFYANEQVKDVIKGITDLISQRLNNNITDKNGKLRLVEELVNIFYKTQVAIGSLNIKALNQNSTNQIAKLNEFANYLQTMLSTNPNIRSPVDLRSQNLNPCGREPLPQDFGAKTPRDFSTMLYGGKLRRKRRRTRKRGA